MGFYRVLCGFYWGLLGCFWFYWVLTRFHQVLRSFTELYQILLGSTGFCWVWEVFIRFFLGSTGFNQVWLGLTGFYQIWLGFAGFSRVLYGFYGFESDLSWISSDFHGFHGVDSGLCGWKRVFIRWTCMFRWVFTGLERKWLGRSWWSFLIFFLKKVLRSCWLRFFFVVDDISLAFFFFTVAKRISRIFLPLPNRSGVFFSLGYEFSRVWLSSTGFYLV